MKTGVWGLALVAALAGGGMGGDRDGRRTAADENARAATAAEASPAPSAIRVATAATSPSLSARIRGVELAVTRSQSGDVVPAVTAGSGMARVGDRIFVAQDDSNFLAVVEKDGYGKIRLFEPSLGADRFLSSLKNKSLKPDIESCMAVRLPRLAAERLGVAPKTARSAEVAVVVALGSGSVKDVRDHVAVVAPTEPLAASRVVTVRARALYARLRALPELTGAGAQLNIEGTVVVGDKVRFFNRGNAGPASVSASADVDLAAFADYLVRARLNSNAAFDAEITNVTRYDLGRTERGAQVAVTDATIVPGALAGAPRAYRGALVLLAAVAEETIDATLDGAVGSPTIALELPDGAIVKAPIEGAPDGAQLKIEGIEVERARWLRDERGGAFLAVELVGVVDPDATDVGVPSSIVRLDVELRPAGH